MRRTVRARRLATWLLLGASLAAGAAFVVLRVATPSDGARIAFYADGWTSEGVRITPIDAPATGLEPGDLVVAIDDRAVDSWIRSAAEPSVARPVAGPVRYTVERDGTRVEVQVAWAPASVVATLLEGWGVVVFSVAFAAIAAFVYARRPDEPAATPLVLAAAGAAGSSIPWLIGLTTSDLVRGGPLLLHTLLTMGVYMLLWPASVHLALVFPAPHPLIVRRPRLIRTAYVAFFACYAAGLVVALIAAPTLLEWIGTWPIVQVAMVVPVLALTLGLLVRSYVRTTDPAARLGIRWATLGAASAALLGLVCFMLPELVLRRPLLPESWIGLTALPVPLGLAAAILRNRLFDIDVVVNRTLVYGGLTLAVVASYAAVVLTLTAAIGSEHGFGVSLLASGAAALVALPLRDVLQRSVNRLMYGERHEPWRAMRRLGQRLQWAAEPEGAFPAIVETVREALRLPYVGLEVAGADGSPSIVAESGTPSPNEAVALPLLHGAEPVGRLLLGVRPGERGFRKDELGLLEDLAVQAGSAVRALRLRDDLARSREALVVAREEERRRLRHDLHDGLGPALAAIGMRAEASRVTVASDPAATERLLDELGDEVRLVLADVRRLVDGLRPPALDELGLLGAIRQQAERLEGGAGGRPGPRITVDEDGSDGIADLPAAVEVAAYRIAVEALTNAVRHAGAETCRVLVGTDDGLVVEVIDDGMGIAADARAGMGLESMHNRAAEVGGELVVERPPGRGTRVVARLPIHRNGER